MAQITLSLEKREEFSQVVITHEASLTPRLAVHLARLSVREKLFQTHPTMPPAAYARNRHEDQYGLVSLRENAFSGFNISTRTCGILTRESGAEPGGACEACLGRLPEGGPMFPGAVEYVAPTSVADAVSLLARDEDAKVLAGGQSLIPLMKLRFAQPTLLVDIGRIPRLRHIELADGTLRLGATVREAEIEAADDVCRAFPILRDTTHVIADPLVRNMATIGGNLAHGDPENDQPATMIALDASVVAEGPSGERTIPIGEFFLGLYYTALEPDEILTEIRIPALPERSGTAYLKVHRQVGDFAIAAVAARVDLDGDAVRDARLVFTGVGMTPERIAAAEDALRGRAITEASAAEAGEIVASALELRDDRSGSAAYKRRVLRTITRRALATAAGRASGPDQHGRLTA